MKTAMPVLAFETCLVSLQCVEYAIRLLYCWGEERLSGESRIQMLCLKRVGAMGIVN